MNKKRTDIVKLSYELVFPVAKSTEAHTYHCKAFCNASGKDFAQTSD